MAKEQSTTKNRNKSRSSDASASQKKRRISPTTAGSVTKQEQSKKALHMSEERYRAIIETSLDGIYQVDTSGKFMFVNESFANMFGYQREELLNKHFSCMLSPKTLPRVEKMVQEVFSGKDVRDEVPVQHRDGHEVPVMFAATPLRQENKIIGLTGILKDVTKLKQVEAALAQSEEWHRALVETVGKAGHGIIILQNLPGREAAIVFANSEACRILGYSQDEALAMSAWDFFAHPQELASMQERYRRRQKGEQVSNFYETTVLRKDGTTIPVEASASTMKYQNNVATVVFFKDITERKHVENELNRYRQHLEELVKERTAELREINRQLQQEIAERKQAEKALQSRERYFHSLVQNALDAVVVTGKDGTIVQATRPAQLIRGYEPNEVIGLNGFQEVHPDDLPKAVSLYNELAQNPGASKRIEVRVRHRDGSWRVVEAIATNLLDDPSVGGIVINYRDITERKRAEEKLQELYQHEKDLRQRLEAEIKKRVELTRALAHELKTPLTPLLISSQVLESELKDEPLLLTLARNISRGATNLNSRIDELLDLAKGEVGILQLKIEPSDILQLLREVAEYVSPVASSRNLSLALEFPDSLPLVKSDAGRVRQVMLNLLNNALKFTPEGGKVTLRACKKGTNLIVEVEDTGHGIDENDLQHIFEPYHRMEGNGEPQGGLGLGLALCKMLVELQGGRIWVKSRLNVGTTFGFSLPLVQKTDNKGAVE